MTEEEFRKYVITEAKKYLYPIDNKKSIKDVQPVNENNKITKSSITPSEIKKLAEEIKKINKKIDFRNPLILESDSNLIQTILESSIPKTERRLDVDAINKSKNINFKNEVEKDKWNRMLKYDIPSDENR